MPVKDRRYWLPNQHRKFNGDVYTYLMMSANKKEAETDATRMRGKGYLIRTVPFARGYLLYYRKGG